MSETQFPQLPGQPQPNTIATQPSAEDERKKERRLQLPEGAISVSISPKTATDTETRASPSPLLDRAQPVSPTHHAQFPPRAHAALRAEVVNMCNPRFTRWANNTITPLIVQAAQRVPVDLHALLTLVKDNPRATYFALEGLRPENQAKLHAISGLLSNPAFVNDLPDNKSNTIIALQGIIQNVFTGKPLKKPGPQGMVETVWSYGDINRTLSVHETIDETVVTKAVVQGYELLKAFAPSEHLATLRNELVYRALLALDQHKIQEIFGPGRNQDWVYSFIKEKWQPESPESLSKFITADDQIGSLQCMQERPDSVLSQFKSS